MFKKDKRSPYLQIDLTSRCTDFHTPESEMTTSKELVMFSDRFVFSQIMEHLPWSVFDQCVTRYDGDKYVKAFTCSAQYRCMAFAQLTCRTSLWDIETCLRTQATKLYHMGIRGGISRTTLAGANQVRDWNIFAEFTQNLIHIARNFHADDALSGLNIDDSDYVSDSTTIDLCFFVSMGEVPKN